MVNTKPSIFIIESLEISDERKNMFGGKLISKMLTLGNLENLYFYIRTNKELKYVLKIFQKSKYRYLLFYCHANEDSIGLSLDDYTFFEFGKIINPYLEKKRLFLSSCLAVNDNFKNEVLENSKCLSVIGPDFEIGFHEAALMWSSFFYLMLSNEKRFMSNENIDKTLSKLFITFNQRMNGYKRMRDGSFQKITFGDKKLQKIQDKIMAIKDI